MTDLKKDGKRLSPLLQDLRNERRDEMMKKTPSERLILAFQLSDACILLNQAAQKYIEERRAARKA